MREEINIVDIVIELERDDLLPAILFRTSRNQCDIDAQRATTNRGLHLAPHKQRELQLAVKEIMLRYEMDEDLISTHPQYSGLLMTAIGAHHAGQLLMWRLLLEELMAAGLLRVLVATGTVAAGVDFPARTVVITAHSRRGSEGFQNLTASEFQQMSGRAGRRGRDTVGFCIAAPAPFCDARALLKISKQPPEPLVSAYFPGPSTVLNLLRYRNVDDLRYTVDRSLAAFTDRKHSRNLEAEARELEQGLSPELRTALASALKTGGGADTADEDNPLPHIARTRDEKKLIKRIRRTYRQAQEYQGRQLALVDSALSGLRKLKYLEGINLSEKGYWAANLCTSIVLELAELIESGVLAGLSAERLVAIVSSIAGDEHRQYLESKNPPLNKEDVERITSIIEPVGKSQMPGVSPTRKVLPSAAETVVTWMHSENWQAFRSILVLSGVAEGDAARLITQTADHLNQLTRLMTTHPELGLRAEEAKRRILRPPLTEGLNLDTI